jgi:hypothetical protein
MKPTVKIRFTEPQIAHQDGNIVDCIGTIKDGGKTDHDYDGSGLARLYEKARRQFTARQTSATILQFPDVERLAKCVA